MKSFNEFVNEGIVNNIKDPRFDGSDPSSIEVYNQGVGGVRSLQGHRNHIVNLLEEMLKEAKFAQKNHKMAHWHIQKIINLADPDKMAGVFLHYLRNHQAAIEELESVRKRGGSGPGKTIPRGLI
jgi:hypothetical protein